jgi:hypothetical protein
MDYKSARLIGASGLLKKNKGVMVVGASSSVQLKLRGLSGGNWIESSTTVAGNAANTVIIVPVQVYGVTLSGGDVFELN